MSWETILRKRDAYRAAFADFEVERVARFGERDVRRLMADAGIVRNQLKIRAAISNARAVLDIRKAFGSLDAYLWALVDGKPVVTRRRKREDLPATTPLAERISKDLRAHGFRFVGPTIVYSFMQAVGMVDDHLAGCFRSASGAKGRSAGRRSRA